MADTPVPVVPTYCSAVDVADVRREARYSSHEDRGRPSLTRVNTIILWAEDEIDRLTKHAWRERRVTNEYRDITTLPDERGFMPIDLRHRAVRALSSGSSDKVEVRAGSTWEDYAVTRTQGIGGDFWIQEELGILYLKRRFLVATRDAVRVTYRYGETSVPGNIQRATSLLAAAELEVPSIRPAGDGGNVMSVADRAANWRAEAHRIIANYASPGGL